MAYKGSTAASSDANPPRALSARSGPCLPNIAHSARGLKNKGRGTTSPGLVCITVPASFIVIATPRIVKEVVRVIVDTILYFVIDDMDLCGYSMIVR